MNERILELESETWREMEKLGKVKWSDWRDKFAELIVRECACIADDMKSLETARAIKEHFGLEEGTMNTFTPIDPGPAATKEIADARNDVLDGLL